MKSQNQFINAFQHRENQKKAQRTARKKKKKGNKTVWQQEHQVKQHCERSESDGWPHRLTPPSYAWYTNRKSLRYNKQRHPPWWWRPRRFLKRFSVQHWHAWSTLKILLAHSLVAKSSNLTCRHWGLAVEARVQSRVTSRGICGIGSGIRAGFPLLSSVSLPNHHPIILPYASITRCLRCEIVVTTQHIITFSVMKFRLSSVAWHLAGKTVRWARFLYKRGGNTICVLRRFTVVRYGTHVAESCSLESRFNIDIYIYIYI
jgi:hypothetical protein